MNKTLKVSIGVGISILCLWFAFRGYNFATLKEEILKADLIWFLPAATVFVLNMCMRTFRWQILLSPIKKLSFKNVFPPLILGFFANNVLPARAGEVVRSAVLSKESDIPLSSVLGSVIVERLTDLFGLCLILLLASQLLPWDKLPVKQLATVLFVGIMGICALVFYVKKASAGGSRHTALFNKLFDLLQQLTAGFRALRSPTKIISVLACSSVIWINELLIALFVSHAMSVNLGFLESAALLLGLSFGVMIPAAPGYIGTYEFFGKAVLVMLGKSVETGLPFILVLHFLGIFLMAILAALVWITKAADQPKPVEGVTVP